MNLLVELILAACARNIHRIVTCEAAAAIAELIAHKLAERFKRQICKAVSADILCDLLGGAALACDEVFFRVDIRTEIA